MSTTRRFPQAIGASAIGLLTTVAVLASAPARADDNMLRGPHPFLKDNELSAHAQLVAGGANTPGGTKIATDYGYRLSGPFWLNLQLNYQRAACHTPSGALSCDQASGSIFETMAGIKLKFATPIPVVAYVKGDAGLAFAFPNGAGNGMGLAVRGGAGANYFFFDWLGLGAELDYTVGHLSTADPSYYELDIGGGLEFQF
jgi:hypothetical protein